jgi:Protein of unknown function (DUF2846)
MKKILFLMFILINGLSLFPSQSRAMFTQEPNEVIVYFYRYKQYNSSALAPSVYCNEGELARIDNGSYFFAKLPTGKHTFRSNDKQSGIEIELKAGETYYIRVEMVSGFVKGHGRLVLMQKEQGSYEIKKLPPLTSDKIKDKTKAMTEEKGANKT